MLYLPWIQHYAVPVSLLITFILLCLLLQSRAQESCTRNSWKSSGTRNLHVCQTIVYKFLAHTRTQLYSRTETVQHVTRTVKRDWPASCCCAKNCYVLASNFSCKFLVQVSWACRWHNCPVVECTMCSVYSRNVYAVICTTVLVFPWYGMQNSDFLLTSCRVTA